MGRPMVDVKLYHGDCLDVLPTLETNSVDLIPTDPPYYKVKTLEWDCQWDTPEEYLAWLNLVLEQFERVLKPNGSLYLFASPRMAARVECLVGEQFHVLNSIRWHKEAGWHKKAVPDALRSYLTPWEAVIFAEHHNADNYAKGEAGYGAKCDELRGFVFEPLRAYLDSEWKRAGLNFEDARQAVSCAAGSGLPSHWFTRSQWILPTEAKYQQLRQYANAHNHGGEYLRRDYEDLRRDYEDLRRDYEDLRRPFYATPERPYTDVWTFPTVQTYPGKHPCEKPVAMMEHIILTSSRPGDVVLDAFMGHGTTGVACVNTDRAFVGIERGTNHFAAAQQRIAKTRVEMVQMELMTW